MSKPTPLQHGRVYHIYNRGTNRQNLFMEERNFAYFLDRYWYYILPVADTFAYSLLWNHYHFLIRIKTEEQQQNWQTSRIDQATQRTSSVQPSQQFSNLFNAYAKAINKKYDRTGSLFEHPFHRVEVQNETYFLRLIRYIHQNPQHHGFVTDFRDWPYTSYHDLRNSNPTPLMREVVLDTFGTIDLFDQAHHLAAGTGFIRI